MPLWRRRLQLVQTSAQQQISVQSQIWRSTGVRVASAQLRREGFVPALADAHEQLAAESLLRVQRAVQQEIERLETAALKVMQPTPAFRILQTMTGVGPVLGLTIALETGDIGRFASVGDYASYCRCVQANRLSNWPRRRAKATPRRGISICRGRLAKRRTSRCAMSQVPNASLSASACSATASSPSVRWRISSVAPPISCCATRCLLKRHACLLKVWPPG